MSIAEIKEELKTMSRRQRLSLEEYLHVLNRIDDPKVQREVDEAMARMDAGNYVTEKEFKKLLASKSTATK